MQPVFFYYIYFFMAGSGKAWYARKNGMCNESFALDSLILCFIC